MREILMIKEYIPMLFLCPALMLTSCAEQSNGTFVETTAGVSLLDEYEGLGWGMSIDEACGVLDGSFEYEQMTEDSVITIHILDSAEYNGMNVQKLLRFNDIGTENGGNSYVLTSISYSFDSYDEIYSCLTAELGEPDSDAEQNGELVCWNGPSLSELYSEDTVNAMYESRDRVGLSQDISSEVYAGYAAESLMLYNIEGQGYLSDDGSYAALAENL